METIFNIGLFIIAVLILVLLFALGADFYQTMRHVNGWVWQGKHGTAVKEFTKEENGCVYFIDVWGNENKICGSYQKEINKE